jgi:hypothetical protein
MTNPLNKSDWDALQAIYNADTLLTQNVEVAVQQLHRFFRLAFDEAKRAHDREVELEAQVIHATKLALQATALMEHALDVAQRPIDRNKIAPCMN